MKGFKDKIRNKWYLRWILLFSNWFFQGILHADQTEKIYRIFFSCLFSFLMYLILFPFFHELTILLIVSFFLGHTINWLVNENIFSIIIHRLLLKKITKEDFFKYIQLFQKRINNKKCILYSAAFGSMARGELKPTSDIDISIVRKPGILNAINSLFIILYEKKIADFYGIPLEIFLSDTPENSKKRFIGESIPIKIYDPQNLLNKYYSRTHTIEEAKKINGIY